MEKNLSSLWEHQLILSHLSHCSPANPEGLTALWVGNVLREVSEDKLKAMFAK